MTKQLIYNTLFFKKEVVLELIQNSTSDLKVYVINISQGPKYYRMTSVYQFINKRINYNTKKFADTRFLTVWDGNRINYGKKYGYIKSSDLISE